ncbi:hypothetical protein Dimus_015934 [Dionaea muscipula]
MSKRLLPRSLLEKMKRATAEDADFRVRVECRRSCRLSPSFPSASPDLGGVPEDGLTPIAEGVELIDEIRPILEVDGLSEASTSPGSGSPVLSPAAAMIHCQSTIDARDDDLVRLSSPSLLGLAVSDSIGGDAEPVVASVVISGEVEREKADVEMADIGGDVVDLGPATGGLRSVVEEDRSPRVPIFSLAALTSSHPIAAVSGDFVALDDGALDADRGATVVADTGMLRVADGGVVASDGVQVVDNGLAGTVVHPTQHDGGIVISAIECTGVFNMDLPITSLIDGGPATSSLPYVDIVDGRLGAGMVSEEGRVLPVAREALRPQPTDGLRQPSSSSVEPARVVESGGGPGDCVGGRSYAHVVQVDRRADVELSYIPPADGGNTITMEESDGDTQQWGSCLVGYFIQGSMPFGFVRSSVTRLWSKLGLTEVKS